MKRINKMKTKKITFNRENKECSGYVDIFDNSDFKTLNSLYFDWKKMNEVVVNMHSRRINLPEIISEGLSSLLFNLVRTNNTSFTNIAKVNFDCPRAEELLNETVVSALRRSLKLEVF